MSAWLFLAGAIAAVVLGYPVPFTLSVGVLHRGIGGLSRSLQHPVSHTRTVSDVTSPLTVPGRTSATPRAPEACLSRDAVKAASPVLRGPRRSNAPGLPDSFSGRTPRSTIATLVERQTRFVMLVHLPDGHGAIAVRDALLATIATMPEHLVKSLTWDQGTELAQHRQITMATTMAIHFCDPHSPWQRGSNENTVSVGGGPVGLFSQAGAGNSR